VAPETGKWKEKHLMHARRGVSATGLGCLAALLLSLTLTAGSAWAQSSQGTINGIVLDASQAAVPAADLTLIELDTNAERKSTPKNYPSKKHHARVGTLDLCGSAR
jgi:hypothetical protein